MAVSDLLPIAAKIGLSALLAGAVGAEREWTGKWAGLRTHMLIAVGSALLTDLSVRIGEAFHGASAAWDPGRVAAQIVSGVGFICAGTIIQARGAVHGLTTAAGLWVASAIGMAVGAEFYAEAAIGSVTVLIILALLRPLESALFGRRHGVVLELGEQDTVAALRALCDEAQVEPEGIEVLPGSGREVRMRLSGPHAARDRLIAAAAARGIKARKEG
jgi:putative Mg2+ transporter-C (MgtC) family protein